MSSSPYIRPTRQRPASAFDFSGAAEVALIFLVVVTASGALFKFGLASFAWALIYAAMLVLIVRDHAGILRALSTGWPLLCFPTFCLLSVFWSVETNDSLRHALQYLFTGIMAFWIGARVSPERLMYAVAIGLFACAAFSVVATYLNVIQGVRQGDYAGAERYFVGLYTQKNVFGNAMVFATIALLCLGATRQQKFRYGLAALALAPILWLTKSTTAMLLYAAAWSFWPALGFAQRAQNKTPFILSCLTVGLLLTTILLAIDFSPMGELLGALGKDATLTGRTVIWDKGVDVYMQRPFLGLGYQAFWESPAYSSDVMLIRAAVLESIGGFHNGYLEAMVATGLPGVVLYTLLIGAPLVVTARALGREPTPLSLGAVYFAVLIASRTFTESSVYFQHDLDFILLIAIAVATTRTSRASRLNYSND